MTLNRISKVGQLLLGIVSLLPLSQETPGQSQNGQAATSRIMSERICGYKPITGFGASSIGSNAEAKVILNEVIKAAGVRPETIGILPANVDNAYACENDEGSGKFKRYILYRPEWLNQLIAEVGTEWTARAILAHEVGHHKKGHNLRDLRDQDGCAADLEAEADEVAGEALARLGASLEEAQTPFIQIAQDKGDQCYPARAERIAAVKSGWVRVKGVKVVTTPTRPITGSNRATPTSPSEELSALISSSAYSMGGSYDSTVQATFTGCSAKFVNYDREGRKVIREASLSKMNSYSINHYDGGGGAKYNYTLTLEFEKDAVESYRDTSSFAILVDSIYLSFENGATAERVGSMLTAIKQNCK